MKSTHILYFLLGFLLVGLIASTTPQFYQPPIVDASLVGNGTHEDPLGADYTKYVGVITQATTDTPEVVTIHNELGDDVGAWLRDSTGVYSWEVDDAPFTTDESYVQLTLGDATALVGQCYIATDSTLVIKTFDDAGAAADLQGNAYLIVRVLKE